MSTLLNFVIESIYLASILTLVAIGFVVLFRATRIVSFAQGYFMLLGPVIYYYLANGAGRVWLWIALPIAVFLVGLVAAASYRLIFARLTGGDPFVASIATIGFGLVLQLVLAMIFGSRPTPAPDLLGSGGFHITSTVLVPWIAVFVLAMLALTCGALVWYLYRTRAGLVMRAAADRPLLGAQTGVNVQRVATIAWGIGGATAVLAGIGYAFSGGIDSQNIPALGLLAFPVLILGGLDSVPGAILAGLIIGVVESATITWLSGAERDLVAYAVMLVVILVRPAGLFGSKEVARL